MSSRRALRLLYLVVPAAVLLSAITVVSATMPKTPSTVTRTTTTDCTRLVRANDTQIEQCLVRRVLALRSRLSGDVAHEGRALGLGSKAAVEHAEADFERYLRSECLAEAAPYRGGSIVPIIYGNCEVALLQGRLTLVERQTLAAPPH